MTITELVGCAVLVGEPMPDWSVDQILAVHFRMHKAEGVLFRKALVDAAVKAKLSVIRVPEKQLNDFAKKELITPLKKPLGFRFILTWFQLGERSHLSLVKPFQR